MQSRNTKTCFEISLSDVTADVKAISKKDAHRIFTYFQQNRLFRWGDANNDCEDRANAICILLDEWQIPNYKGWVFAGTYLKKGKGSLINFWNYHVAALLPVSEDGQTAFYIIDPAISLSLEPLADWAEKVTNTACSYFLIKTGDYYIFSSRKIGKDNWYKRNRRNYNWTMQGLAGINGVSKTGQAALAFNKRQLNSVRQRFGKLRYNKPQL